MSRDDVVPVVRRYIEMTWRDALFLHWPVDPDVVAATLPDELSVATYDGQAYLGVVTFLMEDIRPRGLPRPLGFTFGEANLRTYVEGPDGTGGVYFYNLDAADAPSVALARTLYRLPYYRADIDFDVGRSDGPITVTSHRTHPGVAPAHLDVAYEPSEEPTRPDPDSLRSWFVEWYAFFTEGRRLYRGDIEHDPWDVAAADADLRSTDFLKVNGFDRPDGAPLAHYSPGVDVTADRIRPVE